MVVLIPIFVFGQYPFEKFRAPKYRSLEFKMQENNNKLEYSSEINSFFSDNSDLQIIINGSTENLKETYIQIKTNKKCKKYFEEIPAQGTDGLYFSDFNDDGLNDIKIVCLYMGSGLASLNVRIIYFFQNKNKEFTKISFDDKMEGNRIERDIDGDGNFEIITMTLQEYKNHNYWLFNAYNYKNNKLVCVNEKVDYPIMVQYLYRENYRITNKITRHDMKKYQLLKPKELLTEN